MKDKIITLNNGEVAHLYKMGIYEGGIGSGASFTISKLEESFMVRLKDKTFIQFFATKIYIESLEGEILQVFDIKEVD